MDSGLTPETDFTEMSGDEFFQRIEDEVAEAADITSEEVEEMCPSEIERRIEEKRGEPLGVRMPGPRSEYYSPLLDPPPTRKERQRREEIVDAILDPERSYRKLKWKYRFEDAYDTLEGAASTGRHYLVDETVAFARDIGEALNPKT